MREELHFSDWVFEPELTQARHRSHCRRVRFTRAERAVLTALMESGGRILTRARLLDVISGAEGDAADRSVDFIVHRLRRKLGDSARDARYIATRYGEGYIWVAEPASWSDAPGDVFLVVGPVHGLEFVSRFADRGRPFVAALADAIDRQTAPENRIVLQWRCPPRDAFERAPPRFALTLDFLETGATALECALSLRFFETGAIIWVDRVKVCEGLGRRVADVATDLAVALTDALWQALQIGTGAHASSDSAPLPVTLHEASEQLSGGAAPWADAERRLRRALASDPADPDAQLKLACALHSRYVMTEPTTPIPDAQRQRDEAEIEARVHAALPHIQNDGLSTLSAAKLLYFVNKTHRNLALRLAEQAFESSAAFASAFAILAQLRMWDGDIETAIDLYDRGLDRVEHASYFHLYLLVLKAHAHMAAGYRGSEAADALYRIKPVERGRLGLFYAPTAACAIDAERDAYISRLDETGAAASLRYLHYMAARHFRRPHHRENMMRRPLRLLLERFGDRILADDIRRDAPPDLLDKDRRTG